MATIQKREGTTGVRWRALVRMHGVTESQTFSRKKDAETWANALEAKLESGTQVITGEARRRTLGELIDRYVVEVLPEKKSAKDQEQQLLRWKELLGTMKLSGLTPDRILKALQDIRKQKTRTGEPVKNSTVNRYHAALSHVLHVADVTYGWIEGNPMRKVPKLKEDQGRVRHLDEEEWARLLKACQNSLSPFLLPIVLVAITTGMRKGEIMNLQWSDVDLDRQLAFIEDPKNGRRRSAHLIDEVVQILQTLKEKAGGKSHLLFPGASGFKPIDIKKAWYTALKAADIQDFRFHDLRHTAASKLAMNGASIPQIAAVLGHKSHQMASRYAHLSDESTHQVLEKAMSNILGNKDD